MHRSTVVILIVDTQLIVDNAHQMISLIPRLKLVHASLSRMSLNSRVLVIATLLGHYKHAVTPEFIVAGQYGGVTRGPGPQIGDHCVGGISSREKKHEAPREESEMELAGFDGGFYRAPIG